MSENQYVEMIFKLANQPKIQNKPKDDFIVKPLGATHEEDLYQCYYAAFQAGDAKFFFEQSEAERREFFNSLGLKKLEKYPLQ